MEVVEISREERDVYLIPQNFVDTGTILGGTVKLRNAVEAAVLAVGSAVPLFYLPLAFNIRLMIVIAVSVPLGVFGVVGIGGDSLTQFVAHWFRFMKRRRIVTPTPQGNLEANRHRHLRFISKRYRVVYYDDADTLPHNAQVLQRKADRHGKLVKRQTLYDLLPIEKIENGILHTTDDRYIKILEIEPINFLLRSPREQRSVIYSFASLLKVSPVRLQFKSFSRKTDVNAYLDKLRRDAANEPDAAVRKRHRNYVVIDISELSGDLLTVGMYIGLDYMWDKAKEDLTRRKQIFIDEVWQIIGASSNALAANYVFEAVKTIRGYGGGVLVATQDLNDFFSLEDGKYGRGILNNCKIKIILNLEEEEAQRVQSVLKLTDAEIDNITRFERGSALIVTNSNNVTVDMRCSEEEKDLITTDRDELRRIVERKMQNQTEMEES